MSKTQRVTMTLPGELVSQLREASAGNVSRFVGNLLYEYFEHKRLEELRDALIAGSIANAEEALAIAEEFRYADYEVTMKYVPPSPELESEHADELSSAR